MNAGAYGIDAASGVSRQMRAVTREGEQVEHQEKWL